MLPSVPFTAITRSGRNVTVTKTDGLGRLLHRSFPILGAFSASWGTERRAWQADGRFALDAPDDMDLVAIVTQSITTPFPNQQQDLTQPAAPSVPESQPIKEIAMTKLVNNILVAALTSVQAAIINNARANAPDKKDANAEERKQIKREVFSVVKAKFGIDPSVKVKANTKGTDQKGYLILHDKQGNAFRLNDQGKWDGTMVTHDQLFPPPAPVVVDTPAVAGNATQGTVFGGSQSGGWFRLDPTRVAIALTDDADNHQLDASELVGDNPVNGNALPDPHLMLAGRTDLCIGADGAVYRKA